jgi:flagellar biosynthesis protein FlhG
LKTQAGKLKEIVEKNSSIDRPKTKVLTIASGKGGVGKSVIAANIATLLANRGYKVGIFDAAIGLANLDIIFNIKTDKNLLNLLKGEATLKDIVVKVSDNLSLIPSESGDEIFNFSDNEIYNALTKESDFLDNLDYFIIDTNAGIGNSVSTFIKNADEVIVVTQPDPTAITDAYALIKIASKLNENLNLIVNLTQDEKEGRFIYDRIKNVAEHNLENELFLNFLGSIDTSRLISKSTKLRKLFTKTNPNSIASSQLGDIVDNLILQLEYQAPKTKKKNSFKLFFKRLIENF